MKKLVFAFTLFVLAVTVQAQDVTKLYEKEVTITSAQILASFTTEVVVVSAPNSDYVIQPVSVLATLQYGSATYSDASGTSQLSYAGNSTAVVALSTILAATANTWAHASPAATSLAQTVVKGKNLVYKHTTANPTTGNGTLKLRIVYRLIPVY